MLQRAPSKTPSTTERRSSQPRLTAQLKIAMELTETLQLIARWLTTDPATLSPSFLACIGHPAYGLDALRADLDRFTFLLGGNNSELLLGEDP